MAEEVKKIYKYRDADMDRDLFIKNLNHNYRNYVDSQSWSEDQKKAFRNAYDAHIRALQRGMLTSDIDGGLNVMYDVGDDSFGNEVTNHYNKKGVSASDYDDLKKRKKRKFKNSFYANREVVSYFDDVADALYNKKYASGEKEETEKSEPQKTKFSNKKNDVLGAFIYNYTGGSGELDFKNWLRHDMDENGKFNENPYKNRLTEFYNFLESHINDNEFFENIDYSNTPFKNAENYKKKLQELADFIKPYINNSSQLLTTDRKKVQFYDLLSNLGVDMDVARDMFTGKDKSKTKENSNGTVQEKSESVQASNYSSIATSNTISTGNTNDNKIDTGDWYSLVPYNEISDEIKDILAGKPIGSTDLSARDEESIKYIIRYITPYLADKHFNSGSTKDNTSSYAIDSDYTDSSGNKIFYILKSYNKDNNNILVFTKDKCNIVPLSTIGLTEENLKSASSTTKTETQSKKLGGILRVGYFEDGGNTFTTNDTNDFIKWYEGIYDDEVKWTKSDYAHLGALLLDVGALIDPESFSSCGLSFAGSATDLTADLADENVSKWKAFGTFGLNTLASAAALIPVVGGAGKLINISNKLLKFSAKLGKWLTFTGRTLLAPAAYDAAKETIKKIKSPGGIKNLNTDDFRNIYIILNAIVTGRNMARGTRNVKRQMKLGTAKTVSDANILDVKVKSGGIRSKRIDISDGDLVEAIRRNYPGPESPMKRATNIWNRYTAESENVDAINNAFSNSNNKDYWFYELAKKNIRSAVRPGFDTNLLDKRVGEYNDAVIKNLTWWKKYNPFSIETDWYRYAGKGIKRTLKEKTGGTIQYNEAGGHLLKFCLETPEVTQRSKIIKARNGAKNNQTGDSNIPTKPFYGTDYMDQGSTYYKGGGYGNETVDLSGIKDKENNGSNLILYKDTDGQPFEYNWNDVQKSADILKNYWQSQSGAREQSILKAATDWYNDKNNQDKSQEDFLTYYNNLIDSMYNFKRKIANNEFTAGENGFITDVAVKNFNTVHNSIYSSQYQTANNGNKNAIFDYNNDVSDMFGAASAVRDIDTTENNVDLNFSSLIDENTTEDLKQLLEGLKKDKTGRLYIEKQYDKEGKREERRKNRKERRLKAIQAFNDKVPEAIDTAKYIASRRNNRRIYDIAKKMPILLQNPMEARRSVTGDISAIQQGYEAAGMLNHIASTPLTSDANLQTSTMLNAAIKGQDYINAGYKTNAAAINTSSEQNWNQERKNQNSRYTTAASNRENIFDKKTEVLTEKANMFTSNYASLDNWLTNIETDLRDKRDKKEEYREALVKESIQNDVLNNLQKYGISDDPTMQDLINELSNGTKKYSELDDGQKQAINKINSAVKEVVLTELAKQKGLTYTSRNTDKNTGKGINIKRKGGIIPKDTEKVTIQKLRGQIQKMQARMKYYENNVKASERALERAGRFASNYIKQQTRSK